MSSVTDIEKETDNAKGKIIDHTSCERIDGNDTQNNRHTLEFGSRLYQIQEQHNHVLIAANESCDETGVQKWMQSSE